MRKSPDLMLILVLVVFVGVSLTVTVQATAAEFVNTAKMYHFDQGSAKAGSETFRLEDTGLSTEESELWSMHVIEESFKVNVQLGITYQGEAYDFSTGNARASEMMVANSDDLRYGVVSIEFGW